MKFDVGTFAKDVGKQFVSLYAMDKVGVNDFVNRDGNTITRNLKRGTMWYLSNEAIEQVTEGSSNLTKMNPKVLVDDVAFNTLASYIIEMTSAHKVVEDIVDNTINNTNTVDDILATAIIVEGVNLIGKHFEDSAVKNVSKFLGI